MSSNVQRRFVVLIVAALGLGGCSSGSSSEADLTTAPAEGAPSPQLDVAYADTAPEQRLDLYQPAPADKPAPLVIYIHGGAWRTGDKGIVTAVDPSATPPKPASCTDIVEIQVPDVKALNDKGYAVASINYRLDGNPVHALEDAKAAVRFLRAEASDYHIDPERFAAWGDSAGGYTAIMLGVTSGQTTDFDDPALGNPDVSSDVQAVVDWFGPTDDFGPYAKMGAKESPYTYIASAQSLPPFSIAHGDADCSVSLQQSRHLKEALTKAGGTASLSVLPGAFHEDPAFMRTERPRTVDFLDDTFDVG